MKIKRQKFVLGLQASIAVLAIWWFSNFQGHCQAKWILVYVKNNATRLQRFFLVMVPEGQVLMTEIPSASKIMPFLCWCLPVVQKV